MTEVTNSGIIDEVQRYVMPLTETTLNRMMEHGKTGMIILSAARSEIMSSNPELDLSDEFREAMGAVGGLESIDSDALYDVGKDWLRRRNARKDRELREDIKAAGYSFTPVYGGYHGQDDTQSSFEPSYVVYNYNKQGQEGDFQALIDFGLKMCSKYRQESIYVQAPGKPPVYMDKDGNRVDSSSSDRFKFNRDDQEYFTTVSRDKSNPQRFTADIQFEGRYINLRPADYNERMRRSRQGEYIL